MPLFIVIALIQLWKRIRATGGEEKKKKIKVRKIQNLDFFFPQNNN